MSGPGETVSTDFTNEPAGEDARARKQLADHAFCSWRAGCVLFVRERVAARRYTVNAESKRPNVQSFGIKI